MRGLRIIGLIFLLKSHSLRLSVCLSYMVTYTIHPLKQNFNSGHEDLHGKILNLSQHRRNKILISTEMDRFQWPLILSQI